LVRDSPSQQYVISAVVLKDQNSSTVIHPIRASTPDDNPVPDDKTRWLLLFPHDSFQHGHAYELALLPSMLFAAQGVNQFGEVRILTKHVYVMSPLSEVCSGYGHFNGRTCVCDPGSHHTGPTCAECEGGFTKDGNGACVRPQGCQANTCGCSPLSTVSHCISVGTCSSLNGKIACNCPANYNGDFCERCAVGYVDLKRGCVADCPGGCGDHGTCLPGAENKPGICKCTGNFDGSSCDTCKPGFQGELCAEQTGSSITKVIGIILGALVLVLLIAFGAWYWRMKKGSNYLHITQDEDFMAGMDAGKSAELEKFGSDSGSESASLPVSDGGAVEFSSDSN